MVHFKSAGLHPICFEPEFRYTNQDWGNMTLGEPHYVKPPSLLHLTILNLQPVVHAYDIDEGSKETSTVPIGRVIIFFGNALKVFLDS